MDSFHLGETIICSIEVKDADGIYVDPATSMNITITDHQNGLEVDKQEMIKDDTGKYHYDFNTNSGMLVGVYTITYIDTDGARISKEEHQFELEE